MSRCSFPRALLHDRAGTTFHEGTVQIMNIMVRFGREYEPFSFEKLNDFIDEIASVAWDRDIPSDFYLSDEMLPHDSSYLRFQHCQPYRNWKFEHDSTWCAFNGARGNCVAYWHVGNRCWIFGEFTV